MPPHMHNPLLYRFSLLAIADFTKSKSFSFAINNAILYDSLSKRNSSILKNIIIEIPMINMIRVLDDIDET